ncbi:MAG: penicillin-binding protein 2, partial [Lachnospiraceae bacterium]|nr:penicillin-binding protein 2 [Lachnospiraceae bacterium]
MKERKKKRRRKVDYKKNMQKRLIFFFLLVVVFMIGLCIKITYINVTKGQNYSNIVLAQQEYSTKTLPYRRGDIVDRNGITLATSIKVYNLIIEPKTMRSNDGKYYEPTIRAICNFLNYPEDKLRDIVEENPNSQYYRLKKGMSAEEIENFLKLQSDEMEIVPMWFKDADGVAYPGTYIKGVWFEEEYVRIYPYDDVACDIIGFVNSGNEGANGIEQQYNSLLNGTDGRKYGYLNSDSDVESVVQAPVDGNTVVSTIDVNIQRVVQENITEFQETVGSLNTAVLVMNPNNGEIYSMASYPFHNLNSPRDLSAFKTEEEIKAMNDDELVKEYYALWRNFCISDTFEPGSTAKIFTVAAALEENLANDDTSFKCKGVLNVGGWDIHCHLRSGHNKVTLRESVMYSCNVAMMELAADMGASMFTKFQELFGIGELTGIDLPGEASAAGLHFTADNMKAADLATNSFGQNFNVTMVQMAAAYASVINGGYYYEPHILKELVDASGNTIRETEPLLIRQTISNATSDMLLSYLASVITDGTAKNVAIDGYTVAGKTGTAEKNI